MTINKIIVPAFGQHGRNDRWPRSTTPRWSLGACALLTTLMFKKSRRRPDQDTRPLLYASRALTTNTRKG